MTRNVYTYLITAMLLAGACEKASVVSDVQEVKLAPRTEVLGRGATKATNGPQLDGTSLGTDNSFVIFVSASNEQSPTFLNGQLFSYTPASAWEASSAVGVAAPVFWPTGGAALDFLALACPPAAPAALSPTWDATYSANSVTISGWDTQANQYDVMYAAANNQTRNTDNGSVGMTFRHAQALLTFTAVCNIADVFTINSISINGLEYSGTFTVDNTRTNLTAKWSALTAADKALCGLNGSASDYEFAVPTTATQCAKSFLVPEQTAKSLTLTYTLHGAAAPLTYTIDLPRTVWKAGYKYTYALSLSPTEILVKPSVAAWDGSDVGVNL